MGFFEKSRALGDTPARLVLFYVLSNFLKAEQQLVASLSPPRASEVFLERLANLIIEGTAKGCKTLGEESLTLLCANRLG
jgi:hypothetical protein